ncbi:TPA: hypothetical protein G8404_004281 [Salmonella enterica]|uniref:Phage tail protein n=1 Tax=Salmonella enterica TaxID=28901 RepID=A0A763SU26_SALER|nr:hypothetical protein [Salmonella enterica]
MLTPVHSQFAQQAPSQKAGIMPFTTVFCIFRNVGLRETINRAAGAMQKDQNGGDIPDKGLFAQNIGAALAFSGGIHIGGDSNPWTTAEFIAWLESCGAFNHPYWMCKGSWDYAGNKVITDTGCGNVCLAGAVVEVMGTGGAITIRVTTPTTTSGGGVASAQFTYINHGDGYAPGWRRDFNTINKPTAGDVGALPITGGRLNGPLGIGTDNALGGNSLVLGDNDTGFKQDGDGVLDVYSNYTHVLRIIGNLVESMVSLKVNGNAVATGEVQAGNGASRMAGNGDIFGSVWGNNWLSLWINNNFVADVQLGAGTSVATWNNAGSWPNTPGYVVTSVWKDYQGENIDGIAYAPLQKRVGSQWYTVQGGTA